MTGEIRRSLTQSPSCKVQSRSGGRSAVASSSNIDASGEDRLTGGGRPGDSTASATCGNTTAVKRKPSIEDVGAGKNNKPRAN